MKKIVYVLMLVALFLVGCGEKKEEKATTPTEGSGPAVILRLVRDERVVRAR